MARLHLERLWPPGAPNAASIQGSYAGTSISSRGALATSSYKKCCVYAKNFSRDAQKNAQGQVWPKTQRKLQRQGQKTHGQGVVKCKEDTTEAGSGRIDEVAQTNCKAPSLERVDAVFNARFATELSPKPGFKLGFKPGFGGSLRKISSKNLV